MAIKKRIVPPPKEIKDYRNQPGLYYEAVCDQCGRTYYPKRPTSKYCSKVCSQQAYLGHKMANKVNSTGSKADGITSASNSGKKSSKKSRMTKNDLLERARELTAKARVQKGKV